MVEEPSDSDNKSCASQTPHLFFMYNTIYLNMKSALRNSFLVTVFLMLGQLALAPQNEALNRGNFSIGSGVGYVNSVTSIQINNGGTVQKRGNTG